MTRFNSDVIVDEDSKETLKTMITAGPGGYGLDVWTQENPHSLINLAPSFLKKEMLKVPEEIRQMEEFQLRRLIRPSPTLNRIRLAFWHAYDTTIATEAHATSLKGFTEHLSRMIDTGALRFLIEKDPRNVAWICMPVISYQAAVTETLEVGLARLRQMMDVSPIQGGKLNPQIAALQLRAFDALDRRVNGNPLQRLQQKVEITGENQGPKLTPQQLKAELEKLGLDPAKILPPGLILD